MRLSPKYPYFIDMLDKDKSARLSMFVRMFDSMIVLTSVIYMCYEYF